MCTRTFPIAAARVLSLRHEQWACTCSLQPRRLDTIALQSRDSAAGAPQVASARCRGAGHSDAALRSRACVFSTASSEQQPNPPPSRHQYAPDLSAALLQVSIDHTQQLPCPPAAAIAAALAAQHARGLEALCDIAEVAEAAGAAALELWLDARQHPAQSMLLPGLAAFQGPAICVSIPGGLSPLLKRLPPNMIASCGSSWRHLKVQHFVCKSRVSHPTTGGPWSCCTLHLAWVPWMLWSGRSNEFVRGCTCWGSQHPWDACGLLVQVLCWTTGSCRSCSCRGGSRSSCGGAHVALAPGCWLPTP